MQENKVQPEKIISAINEIDKHAPVGLFPYEMTWVQRNDEPIPLVDFEDMEGWKLETYGGADGTLCRSREQQLWGQYVAKLVYSGKSKNSFLVLSPPKPLVINESFDCIHIWIFGDTLEQDLPEVAVLFQDTSGKEYKIPLLEGAMGWRQWFLVHKRIPKEILASISGRCCFIGLEVSSILNEKSRVMFFDSLAFYKEELKPLYFESQPKRNLKSWRGQITGLNTGIGTLPFPTREETILPTNYERVFVNTVEKVETNHYLLKYQGSDSEISYEYMPAKGNLDEITVRVNNYKLNPMKGGGIRFIEDLEGVPSAGRLLRSDLIGDVVSAEFEINGHIVEYALRIWQKSLVLDVSCDDGKASEFLFGKIEDVEDPKLIFIPYITYGNTNPAVLKFGSPQNYLFLSIWWDWYRTNASEPFVSPNIEDNGIEIQGGMRYIPKTDGKRNNMYERIFLTISSVFEEVLPTIPNPPAIRGREATDRLWTVTAPEKSWKDDHIRCRRIAAYGIERVMQHSHEFTWRDEGESFTLRLKASPQKGGDAMLKWYNSAQQSLGWLQGMYTNYTDYAPVNSNFSEAGVNRLPDGEWRRAWRRCYAMKPSYGVEWDAKLAKRIQKKFGSNFAYTDVMTAVSPWGRCDYDSRVPGAGTLASTFYAHGQILLNDQKVYGPTCSEGTYQWMYAGLATGNYGWVYTKFNLLEEPLNVAFDLLKIHPLEIDYGMGSPEYYLQQLEPRFSEWRHLNSKWVGKPEELNWYIDRFLSSTIAYGHGGWLIACLERPDIMARSYYMMQQLQMRYAMIPVHKIEYADLTGKMISVSQALATDVIRESRLHVIYESGLEIFVNGNGSSRASNKTWSFSAPDGDQIELPPAGWYAYDPSTNFREFSALVSDRRIDYVISPEYEFLDGREKWVEMDNLAISGAAVMYPQKDGTLKLIDIYGNNIIRFKASAKSGHMTAYDEEGNFLDEVSLKQVSDGWYEFRPLPQGRKYEFVPL